MDMIKQISRHFNIQSSNPIHIMTQESTKEFLNAKGKKHKYNLFMQGMRFLLSTIGSLENL